MMRWKTRLTLQIFILVTFLLKVCRGIKCYQCNSNEDENCDSKSADPKYLKTCPNSHSFCRKLDFVYYFTDSREIITIRECATMSTEKTDCYRGRYSRDSYQRVCECTDSGCNHSVNSTTGGSAILISSQLFICWILSCVHRPPRLHYFL